MQAEPYCWRGWQGLQWLPAFLLLQHLSFDLQVHSLFLFLYSTLSLTGTLLIGFRSHLSDTGWLHLQICKLIVSPQNPFPSKVILTSPGRQNVFMSFGGCSTIEPIISSGAYTEGKILPFPCSLSREVFKEPLLGCTHYWRLHIDCYRLSQRSLVKA